MAFLADPAVPRPPSPTRLVLPFNRSDWLIIVVFAAFLTATLALQGSLVGSEKVDLRDTAVCEQHSFLPLNFLFLAAH